MTKILSSIIVTACVYIAQAGEITNEVKTVVVKMMCDTPGCGGEMRQGGYILTSNPPQYPHTCTVCKTNRTYLICYPELRNEPLKSKLENGYVPYCYGTNTITAFATNNQKELFNWHDSSRPSNWYDWFTTITTNWTTIGTFSPVCGQSGCLVIHYDEEVQRGNIVTNINAVIEWKGKRHELLLESVIGPDVGERRVPKPNQWPQYFQTITNSPWIQVLTNLYIDHIESTNIWPYIQGQTNIYFNDNIHGQNWSAITNSVWLLGVTNSTIPSAVTNNVTQWQTFYGPTEAGTLWQTDGRGTGYWVTNGIVKVDGNGK